VPGRLMLASALFSHSRFLGGWLSSGRSSLCGPLGSGLSRRGLAPRSRLTSSRLSHRALSRCGLASSRRLSSRRLSRSRLARRCLALGRRLPRGGLSLGSGFALRRRLPCRRLSTRGLSGGRFTRRGFACGLSRRRSLLRGCSFHSHLLSTSEKLSFAGSFRLFKTGMSDKKRCFVIFLSPCRFNCVCARTVSDDNRAHESRMRQLCASCVCRHRRRSRTDRRYLRMMPGRTQRRRNPPEKKSFLVGPGRLTWPVGWRIVEESSSPRDLLSPCPVSGGDISV
jgi:hypothetical protein